MKLSLFDFIDETLELYERKMPAFYYAEGQIKTAFKAMFNDGESVVSFRTRIKTLNSLKEKLATKCRIASKTTEPTHKADDLMDRLNLIKNWR